MCTRSSLFRHGNYARIIAAQRTPFSLASGWRLSGPVSFNMESGLSAPRTDPGAPSPPIAILREQLASQILPSVVPPRSADLETQLFVARLSEMWILV